MTRAKEINTLLGELADGKDAQFLRVMLHLSLGLWHSIHVVTCGFAYVSVLLTLIGGGASAITPYIDRHTQNTNTTTTNPTTTTLTPRHNKTCHTIPTFAILTLEVLSPNPVETPECSAKAQYWPCYASQRQCEVKHISPSKSFFSNGVVDCRTEANWRRPIGIKKGMGEKPSNVTTLFPLLKGFALAEPMLQALVLKREGRDFLLVQVEDILKYELGNTNSQWNLGCACIVGNSLWGYKIERNTENCCSDMA